MLSASNASPSASLDDSGPAKGQSASVTGTWHVLATGPDATSELLSSEDSREFKILDTSNSSQTTLFKVDSLAVLGSDGAKETFEAHGNASSFCVVAGNEVHILTEDCAEHGATITFGAGRRRRSLVLEDSDLSFSRGRMPSGISRTQSTLEFHRDWGLFWVFALCAYRVRVCGV